MRAKLSIGAEHAIVVPPRSAEALGLTEGGEVDVITGRGTFALLVPVLDRRPQAYLAGSLAALTVPEVVQFVFTTVKSGVLLLAFGTDADRARAADDPRRLRRKSVYFRDGQVVFASSSDPADRLGPVLWRNGLVGPEELERCAALVRSGRPLGQVLVDEGVITSGQLYAGVTLQVREILLGAFLETAGEFAFLEGTRDDGNAVKLPERTRELLLEGMRRIDEVERLGAEGVGRDVVLAPAGAPPPELDFRAAALLAALDGRRSLADAASDAGLALLDVLRLAAPLLASGVVAPAAGSPAATAPAEEEVFAVSVDAAAAAPGAARPRAAGAFETYRRIFERVYRALAEVQPDARARLDSYFDRLGEKQRPLFEGVRFGADGDVDVAQVLVNVDATGAWRGAAAKARALEALEDLLAFALFEVKNCLPREDAEALLREVGRMQVGKA